MLIGLRHRQPFIGVPHPQQQTGINALDRIDGADLQSHCARFAKIVLFELQHQIFDRGADMCCKFCGLHFSYLASARNAKHLIDINKAQLIAVKLESNAAAPLFSLRIPGQIRCRLLPFVFHTLHRQSEARHIERLEQIINRPLIKASTAYSL